MVEKEGDDVKAKTAKRSAKGTRKVKRVLGLAPSGCGYSVKWSVLASTKGLTQVWVPTKAYDRAAAHFIKGAKGRYAKNLLQARMAPLGLGFTCGGTCSGGWCKQVLISDDGTTTVHACQCTYFV